MVKNVILKLKANNQLDNTYVIFTSDNGFHIGNLAIFFLQLSNKRFKRSNLKGQYSMPWDKRLPYETDIKIPFLVRGPRIVRKSLTEYPISAVDVAPTILDLAGVRIPEYMEGITFKDALFNVKDFFERVILIEYYGESDEATVNDECPQSNDNNVAVRFTLNPLSFDFCRNV